MSQTSDTTVERSEVLNLSDLEAMNLADLRSFAHDAGLTSISSLKKQELIFRILQAQAEREGNIFASGTLETVEEGHGFLRQSRFLAGPNDIYVSQSQIRRFGLRTGDEVAGQVRPPKETEKYFGLLRVEAVNGVDPDTARLRPHFEELTPIHPIEQLKLETGPDSITGRVIDLITPLGKGQRALILAPPGAGRSTLLQQIAAGIAANSPTTHLLAVLTAERPEDVTDMEHALRGDVVYSTFDEPAEIQIHVAEMALERAKRLVEGGRDVVLLLDSMTALVRAHLTAAGGHNFTLLQQALRGPRRLFAAARNIDRGGSLTVIATFLTGSERPEDDATYLEFRDAANLELRLDREIRSHRIFPPIDLEGSCTRHEELLLEPWALHKIWGLRGRLATAGKLEAIEVLLGRLAATPDNATFLQTLTKDVA